MKNWRKVVATAASLALVASTALAPSAFAAGEGGGQGGGPGGGGGGGGQASQGLGDVPVADGTSWTIPTSTMTNVVTVDGKDYKVITGSGSGPVVSGPDWCGVSVDQYLCGVSTPSADTAASATLIGVFGSAANEVPNAYNWNYFYNLYNSSTPAELTITNSVSANSFDATAGVCQGFRYRPEVLWGTTRANVATAIDYINKGEYYTAADTPVDDASKYAAPHDSDYDAYEAPMGMDGTVFEVCENLYTLADNCEKIIEKTANYDGMYNGAKVTAANATTLSMNALPRTTRYEASAEDPMSARDCALAFEQLEKGSVYYALSQVAAGKVKKKKVAFVTADPTDDSNEVTLAVFDCADAFTNSGSGNGNAGFAGLAPVAVDQLVTSTDYAVQDTTYMGSGSMAVCKATADDLAGCDCVVITGSGSTNGTTTYTQETLKAWVVDHCTTEANKKAAANIQYDCISCTQHYARNKSTDKSIYTLHTLDFVYSELFPNMELETYWYDRIFHITKAALVQSVQWGLGVMSLPDGADLANINKTYSQADMLQKFYEGYEYYASGKDTVLKNLAAGKGLIGTSTFDFSYMAPSETYATWAADYKASQAKKGQTTAQKAQKVKISTKKLTIKAGKKGKVKASAKTAITFAKKSGNAKIKVTKKGIVKVKKSCKKGTYKIKVTASAKATTQYKKAVATKTIKIKVKK